MNTQHHRICGKRVTVENQKNGINLAHQLEKRAEDEQKKKTPWNKKLYTGINSKIISNPVANCKTQEVNSAASHYQRVMPKGTNTIFEGVQPPCYFDNRDVRRSKNAAPKPWIEAASLIIHDKNNYTFRLETSERAIARTSHWKVKLQHLLAVRTSNTLCA